MVEANRLIEDYIAALPNMTFVYVASPLLNEEGRPKDVYVEDGLHLSQSGYRLWDKTLQPYLR
jgi:lysophospholipase L1-like esterase